MGEPEFLPPRSSGRRKSSDMNSPEFEFCTSFRQPNLLSADELFAGGVLLPLHRINISNEPPPAGQETEPSGSGHEVPDPEPSSTDQLADLSATPALTSSKRWMGIFKKSDKKTSHSSNNVSRDDINKEGNNGNVKEKKREKKNGVGVSNGVNAAELNINIWPFLRSRSAGNCGTRPRGAASAGTHRKVSSAPCSRSNSGGESKTRKWPSSPSRGGVHLGRSSPVWQVRRSGSGAAGEVRRKIPSGGGGCKTRVLNLNVPMCVGYRHGLSCRSDENSAVGVAAARDVGGGGGRNGVAGEGVRVGNLFNIRGLFTRKVY